MKYATRPTPHDRIEGMCDTILRQCYAIHKCETGTDKYRLTNAGRLERLRRETVGMWVKLMDETA